MSGNLTTLVEHQAIARGVSTGRPEAQLVWDKGVSGFGFLFNAK